MPADLAAINAALKTTWTSTEVEEQLYQEAPTLSQIEKDGGRFKVGDVAKTPLHVSRNGGFTALGDNETTLNTAGNQGHDKATWTYKHLYQPIEVTDQALSVTASDATAVVNVLDAEVKGGINDLRHQIERQLFAGADGAISGLSTASSVNTLTLDAAGIEAIRASHLFVGAQIDIGTTSAPSTIAAGRTITAIPAGNQITIDGAAVSVTAGTHNIYWKGSRTGSSTNREITSLRSIVSTTGVIGGIDPATQPVWKSPLADTGSTTALTLPAMYYLSVAVLNQGNASARPDTLVLNPIQQQILFQQLQTQMRFTGSEVSTGDPTKVTVPGLPTITMDPLCPITHVYALSRKHLFLLEESKPYWVNERFGTGGILAPVPGTVRLQGVLGYHVNLGTDARNAHSGYFALATS